MKMTYDPYADALNITFREGKVYKTEEIAPEVYLDVDKKGRPLYLEIIGASEKRGKERVADILVRSIPYSRKELKALVTK